MSYLKSHYDSVICNSLKETLGIVNKFQIPKLEKIVLNMTSGEAAHDSKKLSAMVDDMTAIAGQKPVVVKAKKSIAGFKLREGMNLGCKVTLRRERMYSFFERFINIAAPRIRDFRGFSVKSFNGSNYSLGIKEQIIFPEINYDKVDKIRGMDITICTNARNEKEARALLESMNFPFSGGRLIWQN